MKKRKLAKWKTWLKEIKKRMKESFLPEIAKNNSTTVAHMPNWLLKGLKYLFFAFWILCSTAIITEVLLREFDPIGLCFFDELKAHNLKLNNTPYGYYKYYPGDRFVEHGNLISINSEGFRYRDFPIEKPKGTIRILCLGDSLVVGSAVPLDTIFWAVLQKMAESDGFPCEIIPAGASSWNTVKESNFFHHRGIQYSPDVLILLTCSNDLWDLKNTSWTKKQGYKHDFWKNFVYSVHNTRARALLLDPFGSLSRMCSMPLRYSYVSVAYNFLHLKSLASKLAPQEVSSALLADTKSSLQKIVTSCNAYQIRPLFFIGIEGGSPRPFEKMYRNFYSSELEKLGVTAHLCVTTFQKRSLRVSVIDTHPSVAGHKLIAESMYPELRAILADLYGRQPKTPRQK